MTDVSPGSLVLDTARSVALAVAPLAVLFMMFQAFLLRLPKKEVVRVMVGTSIASVGLYLFLLGVSLAFLPFGTLIGQSIAALKSPWLALLIGAVLGFVTTWGEPAVRILADEIEEASSGSIRRLLVLLTMCGGVAVSVGVGLLRIAYDIPISYFLVPGYVLVLLVMGASDKAFVAIAADAGGVATGPLANSFLLALALGAASGVEGRDPLVHGLGLVALIALAPILAIMTLGILIRRKTTSASNQP